MFSFLDVTGKTSMKVRWNLVLVSQVLSVTGLCSLEVCRKSNYDFVMNYAVTFARKLPTKKEVQAGSGAFCQCLRNCVSGVWEQAALKWADSYFPYARMPTL